MSIAAIHQHPPIFAPRNRAKSRPGPVNNIGRILADTGVDMLSLGAACVPEIAPSHLFRIKNRSVVPTIITAWRIVAGLRVATGRDLAFHDVFPQPELRARRESRWRPGLPPV